MPTPETPDLEFCDWRKTRCPEPIYEKCVIRISNLKKPEEKPESPPQNNNGHQLPDEKRKPLRGMSPEELAECVFVLRGHIGSNIRSSLPDGKDQSTFFSLVYPANDGGPIVRRRCIASGKQSQQLRATMDLGDEVIVVGSPTQQTRLGTQGQTRKAITVIAIEPVV